MPYIAGSGFQEWSDSLYYHIAQDALERARHATTLPAGDDAEWERKKGIATMVVFSSLCLEAFINKQYFLHGKPVRRNVAHYQRWLDLPGLLDSSNQTFSQSAEPFVTFEKLIRFRNDRLVHFKPAQEGSDTLEPNLRPWAEEIGDLILAERYFNCVTEMVELLHRLTQGKTLNAVNSIHGKYVRTVWSSLTSNFEAR